MITTMNTISDKPDAKSSMYGFQETTSSRMPYPGVNLIELRRKSAASGDDYMPTGIITPLSNFKTSKAPFMLREQLRER